MVTKKIKANDKIKHFKRQKAYLFQCQVFSKSNSLHNNTSTWSNVKYLLSIPPYPSSPFYSLLNLSLLYLSTSILHTQFFIINSNTWSNFECLFKNNFLTIQNAKTWCACLYIIFKYLGYQSYLAWGPDTWLPP